MGSPESIRAGEVGGTVARRTDPTASRTAGPSRSAWRTPRRDAALVFLGLLIASAVLNAFPALTDLANRCVGACVRDFRLYVWSMAWLGQVARTGADPFWTDLLWAPLGTNLTWVTTLPVPALAVLPVTLTAGPIVATNLLLLLAPPLAGWAMFLVCREITGRFAPSLAGAFVFAFSTYVGQLMRAQLNLLLMFWVPLAVFLFLRYLEDRMSNRRFVILLAAVICGQFLTSTEILAMATFCGGVAWLAFAVGGSRELRTRLLETLPAMALAFGVAVAALLPILVPTLATTPTIVLRPTEQNSADLLGPLIPGVSTRIGGAAFTVISDRFLDGDNFGYFGPIFLGIAIAFAVRGRVRPGGMVLSSLFGLFTVFSMGPRLHILGDRSVWLPGYLVNSLPLLQHAVPVRYVLFAWFVLAVIVAMWLAEATNSQGRTSQSRTSQGMKYAAVGLAILLVLPSQRSERDVRPVYHQRIVVPAFFSDGTFERYIDRGAVILAVPDDVGEELLWQVEGQMRFRLASAYIGPTKPKNGLGNLSQADPPPDPDAFVEQLQAAQVSAVVAALPLGAAWQIFLTTTTGSEPIVVDGVAFFPVTNGTAA